MSTKIKICGITTVDDARIAVSLGVDFLGLIFAESPRRIDRARAREIRDAIPDAQLVGVFLDADMDDVADTVEACGIDLIQLHGVESPAYCETLRDRTGRQIIKAFPASNIPDAELLASYETTSFFLFDLDKDSLADEGLAERVRDVWAHVSGRRNQGFRMFLAGALDESNVREAVHRSRPYCVDVCRGVEESPGVKDPDALRRFVAEARSAAAGSGSGS